MKKTNISVLENILSDLIHGQTFILDDRVLVCVRKDKSTTTLDFVNANNEVCTSIDKEIGSQLTYVHNGIIKLHHFI